MDCGDGRAARRFRALAKPSFRVPADSQRRPFHRHAPRKPLRIEKTAGTTTVIVYLADLPGHAVEIIRAPVPASGSLSLDRAVTVAASALPRGGVVSRHSITYHGQPAEDAVISVLGDPGQIRVVAFGSSAYIFEGFGSTAASFAHDYKVLLDSFRLLHS